MSVNKNGVAREGERPKLAITALVQSPLVAPIAPPPVIDAPLHAAVRSL